MVIIVILIQMARINSNCSNERNRSTNSNTSTNHTTSHNSNNSAVGNKGNNSNHINSSCINSKTTVDTKLSHDLGILWYHYSLGIRYLGSCKISTIHRNSVVLAGAGGLSK